jgi:hypothetical protein
VTDGVRRILDDEVLRHRLRRAGPARAAAFDIDRVGDAAIAAFRSAARSAPDRAGNLRRQGTTR